LDISAAKHRALVDASEKSTGTMIVFIRSLMFFVHESKEADIIMLQQQRWFSGAAHSLRSTMRSCSRLLSVPVRFIISSPWVGLLKNSISSVKCKQIWCARSVTRGL
jgi:hypothetical protein